MAENRVLGISLAHHGVIEAHAGTGKTWTIVQMVLRILQEPFDSGDGKPLRIHIREILLVTFTEKAAGELKARIRTGIEKRLAELRAEGGESGVIEHLENCLNNLHEALIGTIHGICLRLLQTWPFETGVPFTTEIVDDVEGLEGALRESMRTDWQNPATVIPWALEQLMRQGGRLEAKHYELARQTVKELLDAQNTVLDRTPVDGHTLETLKCQLEKCRIALGDTAASQAFRSIIEAMIAALTRVDASGRLEPDRIEILHTRVGQMQEMVATNNYDTSILSASCKMGNKGIYTKAHLKLVPELVEVDSLCDTIAGHAYLAQLKQAGKLENQLPLALICDAALLLRERWVRTKQENGFVSFQDMLRLMRAAVFDGSSAFCGELRQRLRFGIIDEFQDTSILQWQIFEKIFLESGEGGPRMFIVGDPKQSIYSFQGADVQSYLRAKDAIMKKKGRFYPLVENFRSLPQTIAGCNAIAGRDDPGAGRGEDWFKFDNAIEAKNRIAYPAEGDGGELARPAYRGGPGPAFPLKYDPVQIMVLDGNAPRRIAAMARWTRAAIESLRGTTVSIPRGDQWENVTLDYKDFAVIVEAHRLAEPFLEHFQETGIPAVKYKMAGVFQSPMARDLHALLRAILRQEGDPAPRLAALLTRFFNYRPEDIDKEKDLEPCARISSCERGHSCLAHALDEWRRLANDRLWARLFMSIQKRTGIRERLMKLVDGERSLADLRQVVDYCVEKLFRGNFSLQQLVERLGRLLREEDEVGQDQNLHVLATEKSSVKVLTMHAAKGLEFPVVFVVTGGSRHARSGPATLTWVDADHKKHVLPYLDLDTARHAEAGARTPESIMLEQANQERRRLLYVAMTRPQAMLFVPLHLQQIANDKNGGIDLAGSQHCLKNPDKDLTPKLCELINAHTPAIHRFDPAQWPPMRPGARGDSSATIGAAPLAEIPDINELNLLSRICRQTSYTQLSGKEPKDRGLNPSEESLEPETPAAETVVALRPILPGGAKTGDALHLAIEEVLRTENIKKVLADAPFVERLAEGHLARNRILADLADREEAVSFAAAIIRGALTAALPLPGGGSVTIADLASTDRIPEMEFLLNVSPVWVHGYMDLVFRLKNESARHPWRYYVLDWKSDQLPSRDADDIDAYMKVRHYDLQAKIYSHALDAWLAGVLGDQYDPKRNLGGAVYVFLRTFDAPDASGEVWIRAAEPVHDQQFVIEKTGRL